MGFPKSMKRSKKHLSKNELKGYAWPKPIPHIKRKRKKKCGKIKYMGALLSKYEKTKNVRMYTFGSTKDVWTDDDSYTISTASVSSFSDRDLGESPEFVYDSAIGLQGLNLRQIRTSASSESFSSPSLSSYTDSSDDSSTSNQYEVRDDASGVIIRMRESREVPMPPLIPPPPRYVSDSDKINADADNDLQTSDVIHEEHVMQSEHKFEIRHKSLRKREIRRQASDESRDFVHVFHQPLPPLEEDTSLYSGDDADDELCDDDSSESEHSPPRNRRMARRGSMTSIEDEIDLRQRWEYGLAMMAKMGMNAVGNLREPSASSITTLSNENEYDEGNSEEI